MPTYNAENHVAEAIESVLKQSFDDFEFIIVDDGSEDDTLSIIRSYADARIKLFENSHDYIGSLNSGIKVASGKYIARMDADDRMHTDRLRIQYAVMEENPAITVCSSWVSVFGKEVSTGATVCFGARIVEHPLLLLLKQNVIIHPSVMMRTEFLHNYSLKYEAYDCAEDYKLWVEIAKLGGTFHIESQPLLYYRVSDEQISNRKKGVQMETSMQIRRELLGYLIGLNHATYPSLTEVFTSLQHAKEVNLLSEEELFSFFSRIFERNKNSITLV